MPDNEFPVAQVAEAKPPWWAQLSRMWVVTLGCVLLAIGLTWMSIDSPGPEIVIHFAEGHGLKEGDTLQHRGIEIGRVESVRLNPTLEGIEVTAVLNAEAAPIACEGSRFWIVRPQLDLTGISGLETAVGAKYIEVQPGRSEIAQTEFDGLSNRPPDGLGGGGIEIILRGDFRYGVNPGSPVNWRGVTVGQVLSSSLSPDALHVDTRVRIVEAHRRLLSRESKFWVTSGIQMGLDVGGFEFSAASLAEIARGGISFITPGPNTNDMPVKPGDVFTLYKDKDDDWLESAVALNLLKQLPPPMAIVTARWKQKVFGFTGSHESHSSALTVPEPGRGYAVIMPADLARPHPEAVDGSYQLSYDTDGEENPLTVPGDLDATSLLAAIPLEADETEVANVISSSRFRMPDTPEDCFAVRRSWHSDRESALVIEMISKSQLTSSEDAWNCSNDLLSRDVWHGAIVLAAQDEKVIGMLVIVDHKPIIAPLTVGGSR